MQDSSNPNLFYMVGWMEENGVNQPLIALFNTVNMSYTYMFMLQILDGSARQAWSIADTPDNNLVSILIETDNPKESLLIVLHKASGAPALDGFKFGYPTSSTMGDIKPNRINNLHWQDATTLWIVTSYYPDTPWSTMSATTFKSVALKVKVDVTAKTFTIDKQFASANGEVFTTSTMYSVGSVKMLAIGAAVYNEPSKLKVLYHNTADSTTQVREFDYTGVYSSFYGGATPSATDDRQAIRHLSHLYVDGTNDVIYGSTDNVE
jgi:hypothetical protein